MMYSAYKRFRALVVLLLFCVGTYLITTERVGDESAAMGTLLILVFGSFLDIFITGFFERRERQNRRKIYYRRVAKRKEEKTDILPEVRRIRE